MSIWQLWSPVTDYWDRNNQINDGIEFSKGVILQHLPEWARSGEALAHFNIVDREEIEHAGLGFKVEYDANSISEPHISGRRFRSLQNKAEELIKLSQLALWIVKPSRLSSRFFLHFDAPGTPQGLRESSSEFGLDPHIYDLDNRLSIDDFSKAATIHDAICGLHRKKTMWNTITVIWKSLIDQVWEVRFLLQWVAMEAIFGARSEITFRLSQRVAFFIGENSEEIQRIFHTTKKNYGWRSKVVHGRSLANLSDDKSTEISHELQELIRKASNIILQKKDLINRIDGEKREEFLDSLVFK